MKKRNLQRTKKRTLFALLILVAIILSGVVFSLSFFQKKTYLTADLYVTGGEWWWGTASPPYWLGEPVQRGAVEYDMTGKKIVEILGVQKFDYLDRETMILHARLLVTKNLRTKKYRFRQNPLEIGATIEISPGNVQMYANVIGLEGVQEIDQPQVQRVTVRWYNIFPWQADAILVGDTMSDNSGREVARVLQKEESISEKTVVTENPQAIYGGSYKDLGRLVLLNADPSRRDVTLIMDILTRKVGKEMYFGYTQTVKIGEPLYISLSNININPQIISIFSDEK